MMIMLVLIILIIFLSMDSIFFENVLVLLDKIRMINYAIREGMKKAQVKVIINAKMCCGWLMG